MDLGVQATTTVSTSSAAPTKRKLWSVSPSQVDAFRRCPRVWYNQTVLKEREPDSPSKLRGTAIHSALEIFLKTGEVLPVVEGVGTLEFVQVAIPHIPRPMIDKDYWSQFPVDEKGAPTAMLLLEQPGEMLTWQGGPSVTQFIDSVQALPKTCKIQDYKTTSDFRYAKTPEELRSNTQLCWNAKYIFAISDYDQIEIEHLYLLTKGRPKARPVSTFVTREQVEAIWERDMSLVRQMVAWAELAPPTADALPPNVDACDDYGGCYYRTKCGFDVATVGWKKRIEPMSETAKNGLLSDLINKIQPVAPGSQVVKETKAAMKSGQVDLLAALGKVPAVAAEPPPVPSKSEPETIFDASKPAASAAEKLRESINAARAKNAGITPPDAPPATSTPEEVAAANQTPAAAAAAEEDEAPAKKRGRGRPPKKDQEEAAPETDTLPPSSAQAPAPAVEADLSNVETLRKILMTPDPQFQCGLRVLFIDTYPAKGWNGDHPVDLADMMHAFEKAAATAAGKADYRQIPYEGKAYLKNAITVLMAGLPTSVYMDSRIPGADVFLSVVTPYCSMIFRGVR
jgi:hypothetical protein